MGFSTTLHQKQMGHHCKKKAYAIAKPHKWGIGKWIIILNLLEDQVKTFE